MKKKIFGFDLGIASIGWAVIDHCDENFDPETGEIIEGKVVGCGVRCFPVAENPKDGSSLAAPRREKRLLRRITRRKARRMLGIKRLFVAKGLVASTTELEALYAEQTGGDVWNLRAEALRRPLSKEELLRVLTHLAKHRGFKSYRKAAEEADKESGRILTAIAENRKETAGFQTLAQMIVERAKHSDDHKMRNYTPQKGPNKGVAVYVNSIPREDIEKETKLIFEYQKQFGLFTEDLYRDFCRIAFRYREAGSVGHMVGRCRFEPEQPRAPKEAPSAELFVALSKINNLKVTVDGERRFLNGEERKALLELLKNTKEVKYSTIKNKLFKGREVFFDDVNYAQKTKKGKSGEEKAVNPEDAKFYAMKGWHKLKAAFSPEQWKQVGSNLPLLDLGMTAVVCEKNDAGIERFLSEKGIPEDYREVFKKLTGSEFINLSLKALYKLNPYLEEGLKYKQSCEKAGYDSREDGIKLAEEKGLLLPPIADDKLTTVPVVNRAVAQFRKVYNAMVRTYGAPDQINLEIGRDLKKSRDERNQIMRRQKENEAERKEAEDWLEKEGLAANGKNMLKYRLYRQQNGKCIYSGKAIDLRRLDENGYCDVDHIIPYSRSLDDGQNNKVLCLAEENRKKGSKTPYEYLEPLGRWEEFETVVNTTPSINRYKRNNLLNKDYKEKENDLEFRERNANDNSYIARYVKRYLKDAIDFSASSCAIGNRVQVRTGSLTDYLRHQWGLIKDRDASDRHHAQDAVVVACATQGMVQKLSKLSAIFENKDDFRRKKAEELGHEKAEAWYKYVKQQIREPWSGFRTEVLAGLEKVFVSRPPRKNATGSAHKDTIFSKSEKKGSLPIRYGMAEKENMFRLDVFRKENHFYIVPIYVVDLVNCKEFTDAPQPYEYINGSFIKIDESFNFMFSLYKDDYVEITSKDECIKGYVNQYNAQSGQLYIGSVDNSPIFRIKTSTFLRDDNILLKIGDQEYIGKIGKFDNEKKQVVINGLKNNFMINALVKLNKKGDETKNIQTEKSYTKMSNEKKICLNVVDSIEKYQVDPLGRIAKVKKETRLPLTMIKKNRHKKGE